jgi:hypothetical protein
VCYYPKYSVSALTRDGASAADLLHPADHYL